MSSSSRRGRVGGSYDAVYTYNLHYTHTQLYNINIKYNNYYYYVIPARVIGIVFPIPIKYRERPAVPATWLSVIGIIRVL